MQVYESTVPSWVDGVYYPASPEEPARIEVPDDYQPSRKWQPIEGTVPPPAPVRTTPVQENDDLRARIAALEKQLLAHNRESAPANPPAAAAAQPNDQPALSEIARAEGDANRKARETGYASEVPKGKK